MKAEMAGKIKYGVWGLICGAVIAMIIGFVWGGWVTSSTSQTKSDAAVLASQAAICVAQVVKDPNVLKNLREWRALRDGSSSKRGVGTKCRGKKSPVPALETRVLRGLKFLLRNKTNQKKETERCQKEK